MLTIILPWIDRGIRLPSLLRFVLCMGRMQRGQTLLTLPTTMFISHAFDTSRVTFKGLAFWPNWSLFSHMYAYFMRSLTTNQMRLPSLTWIFGTRRNVTWQVFFLPLFIGTNEGHLYICSSKKQCICKKYVTNFCSCNTTIKTIFVYPSKSYILYFQMSKL